MMTRLPESCAMRVVASTCRNREQAKQDPLKKQGSHVRERLNEKKYAAGIGI